MAKPTNPRPPQRKMKTCPACYVKGSGNCYVCCGKGYTEHLFQKNKPCVKCNKSGKCVRCKGKGVVPED